MKDEDLVCVHKRGPSVLLPIVGTFVIQYGWKLWEQRGAANWKLMQVPTLVCGVKDAWWERERTCQEEEQPEQRDRVELCTLPRGGGACVCADHCLQRGTGSRSWPELLLRRAGRVRSFSTFNLVLCPTCKSLAQLLKYYYYCSYHSYCYYYQYYY